MKVKFIHLEGIVNAINEVNKCKMSFQTKLKLRDVQEAIKKETTWFDEQRIELLKKHSKKDDKGDPIIEDNNYAVEYTKEMKIDFDELLNTEFKIKAVEPSLFEGLELSGTTWDGLMQIIEG